METFEQLKKEIRQNARGDNITEYIKIITDGAISYLLNNTNTIDLKSGVKGKEYLSYSSGDTKSRAVNRHLFQDMRLVNDFLELLKSGSVKGNMSSEKITSAFYTITMSLACYIDITSKGDRQTPGTFFEYLVTHAITRYFEVNPSKRITVDVGGDKISLTMDLVLNVDKINTKYHIAVKNSTRERASEIWAHQRILDKAFGENTYTGIFIGLSETKLDHTSNIVTEICVPDQWRAYQQFISNLQVIYYVDLPDVYNSLNRIPPYIAVKQIGDFYS